jgi:hypothetical protein
VLSQRPRWRRMFIRIRHSFKIWAQIETFILWSVGTRSPAVNHVWQGLLWQNSPIPRVAAFPFLCDNPFFKHVTTDCEGAICCNAEREAERAWSLPSLPCNLTLASRAENSCDWPSCLKRRLHSQPIVAAHPTQKMTFTDCAIAVRYCCSSFVGAYSAAVQTHGHQYPATVQVHQQV